MTDESPLENLVGQTIPKYWTAENIVTRNWIGRGVAVRQFNALLDEAVKAKLIEVRSASLSLLGERGDDDLPTSDEGRARTRQIRRIFTTQFEVSQEWRDPPAITLEQATKRHHEQFKQFARSAPPSVDPVRQALIDAQASLRELKERDEAQSELIAELVARLDEIEESEPSGFLRRRKR